MSNLAHKVILYGAVLAGGLATRAALEQVWEAGTDRPAPKNPAADGVSWRDALMWAAAAGVVVGVARTAIRRTYAGFIDADPEEIEPRGT